MPAAGAALRVLPAPGTSETEVGVIRGNRAGRWSRGGAGDALPRPGQVAAGAHGVVAGRIFSASLGEVRSGCTDPVPAGGGPPPPRSAAPAAALRGPVRRRVADHQRPAPPA